mmetsp:Transcript_20284/g.46965  ORF Transcript_20284/g.46965 Transcript_20284/m.46965 type:complete len:203 (+) Transcript_20284:120-728(+)|eukprot:CAMPEP_0116846278 /NCGR_PEP_ID=MMETSP0418-20121206/13743_1 /TAXON_ID=1158023 /ORGANISM="Astrosyne radiata, Strain 13vi08-1A" /LENGTH=202 /DNA_ID=CAMNT_0004477501 /DNA_START=46 /DNA_END=654 /DNA_ORIENTATION=-
MTEGLIAAIEKADQSMFANKPKQALTQYDDAWKSASSFSEVERIWLLLATANAAIRCEDSPKSQQALGMAYGMVHTGVVVGNPFFHLLVGLTYQMTGQNPQAEQDNFARAFICGGPEIFQGEDPAILEKTKSLLAPPEGSGSWDDYVGVSRDSLNGAKGYLAMLIEKRFGQPLPYEYEDNYSDEDDEFDDEAFDDDSSLEGF